MGLKWLVYLEQATSLIILSIVMADKVFAQERGKWDDSSG